VSEGLDSLIAQAGFPRTTPVVIATCDAAGEIVTAAGGRWPQGRSTEVNDLFYAASLAKQVTGAGAALLVRSGELDPDLPVSFYVPDLPPWAGSITTRQVAHHTAGLPEAAAIEKASGDAHWTTEVALAALGNMPALPHPPGAAHIYSNAGYILLAQTIERVSAQSFADFVETRLLAPHGIIGMRCVTTANRSLPQLSMLGARLPLSAGDGGLWASAPDFARWLHLMNRDAFGVEPIVTSAGRTLDGRPVDYGWGIGLAVRNGHPLYFHSGSWPGAVARALRLPTRGAAVVAMAASDDAVRLARLVDDALAALG
jgi:CubicO group peptidase (beta-lactamase class C family)